MAAGRSPQQGRVPERVATAASRYVAPGGEVRIEGLGEGNINATYLVKTGDFAFVLQRINRQVFPRPELVVENFSTVTAHLAGRDHTLCPQWRDIHLIPTTAGLPFYRDAAGDVWRAQSYIDDSTTFSVIDSPDRARQVGWALGRFHRLVADLPCALLHETLPGFHVLSGYLGQFDRVGFRASGSTSPDLGFCLETVARHRAGMQLLGRAEASGRLVARIIHGDPKAANVLFHRQSERAVCLIDLDTVRPGLLLYDLGDCLRSCCNRAGEEGDDPEAVRFDVEYAHEILTGYSDGAGDLFTLADRRHVVDAVHLLCFELGLRFLTDYLEGNRYFRVRHPHDNLERALRQFHLLRDVIAQGNFL